MDEEWILTPTSGKYMRTSVIGEAKEELEVPIWGLKMQRTQFSTNQKSNVASSSSWRQMVTSNSPVSHNRKSENCKESVREKALSNKIASRTELLKRALSYEYVESYLRRWEMFSVHYKRGFSGPENLGEFLEEISMKSCWGLIFLSVHEKLFEDINIIFVFIV